MIITFETEFGKVSVADLLARFARIGKGYILHLPNPVGTMYHYVQYFIERGIEK